MKKTILFLMMLCLAGAGAFASGAQEDASGDSQKVTMATWFPRPVQETEYDEVGVFLEKYPDIELEHQLLEGSRYQELLRTRITAGDIPDVMVLMTPQVKAYGNLGILADVSDTPMGIVQAGIPSLNAALSVDGRTVAINGSGGVVQHPVFYNKLMFEKYGLQEPETSAEFEEVCRTLYEAGEDVILFGGADTWPYKHGQFAFGFTDQVGTALEETGTSDLMRALYEGALPSDVYGGTLRFFEDMVKKGYVARTGVTMTWPESFRYFIDGNCAMLPQGPWIVGMVENQIDPPIDSDVFELGVMFYPEEPYEGKRYFQGYLEYNYALSTEGAENPAAVKLFEFLTSEENLTAALSDAGRPTLFPLELTVENPVQQKMNNDLNSDDVEIVVFSFPEATGWGEKETPSAFAAVHAGERAEEALKDLDAFYADHKADIQP
jgi:ABC-type glycerol-3-phosphate transport system substrate-binding protein